MEIDVMPDMDVPGQGLAPDGVTFDEVVNVIQQWCGEVLSETLPPPEFLREIAPDDLPDDVDWA